MSKAIRQAASVYYNAVIEPEHQAFSMLLELRIAMCPFLYTVRPLHSYSD